MRRWATYLTVGLAAALPAAGQAPARPPARAAAPVPKESQAALLAQRAEGLLAQGKFTEGAALLQQAAALTPDDWTLWDRAGWALLDAGQDPPALAAFEKARAAAPPGTPLPGGLLIAHYLLGHGKETAELLKRLVPSTSLERAQAVTASGLEAGSGKPEWNLALGYLFTRVLGASARGLGPLEAAAQADPKNAQAWLLLVELNQALSRDRAAAAAAVKYLELDGDSPDAYRIRGARYASLKQDADAVAEYRAGIEKHPAAAELYYGLARLLERAGAAKQAQETYDKLVAAAAERKLEPLRQQARAQLANFHARQRNYAEAEKYYREAAGHPEAALGTVQTWAALLALTGKWEEAARRLDAAAAREEKERSLEVAREDLLSARYRAAVTWLAAGNRDAARSGLQKALLLKGAARTGPHAEAQAFLAWLDNQGAAQAGLGYLKGDERWAAFTWRRGAPEDEFEVRGRFSPGATAWRATLQQVQKALPGCWPADYALARIYAAGGFTQPALQLLEKAARARADWWAPFYAQGQYYARERRRDEGASALRTVLRLAPECRPARATLSLLMNVKDEDEKEEEKEEEAGSDAELDRPTRLLRQSPGHSAAGRRHFWEPGSPAAGERKGRAARRRAPGDPEWQPACYRVPRSTCRRDVTTAGPSPLDGW